MKVFVLIPTRNRKELLSKCLDSLSHQTYKNVEIIVIDDGSTDGTREMLIGKPLTVLEGDGNLWWTGDMRKGVEYITPKFRQGDFVLIQNDDTYMKPKFLEELVEASEKNDRMIIGTSVRELDSQKLLYNSHRIVKGSFRPVVVDDTGDILRTDTLSGRGVLIPVEVFDKVKNFSKVFPHYAADYDFFCRALKKGFRLGVYSRVETFSTNVKPNLAKRIKSQKRINFRDFFHLYFSRRSSNNLWSSMMVTILHVPWRYKFYGVLRIKGSFIKILLIDCILKNYFKLG